MSRHPDALGCNLYCTGAEHATTILTRSAAHATRLSYGVKPPWAKGPEVSSLRLQPDVVLNAQQRVDALE